MSIRFQRRPLKARQRFHLEENFGRSISKTIKDKLWGKIVKINGLFLMRSNTNRVHRVRLCVNFRVNQLDS